MEFQYLGMTFIYHPKKNEYGRYFEHKLSGHSFYDKDQAYVFGRPTKKTVEEVVHNFVDAMCPVMEGETIPCRLKTLLTYKEYYPE